MQTHQTGEFTLNDTEQPYRKPSYRIDRLCDVCLKPMTGILKISEIKPFESPRTICYSCKDHE